MTLPVPLHRSTYLRQVSIVSRPLLVPYSFIIFCWWLSDRLDIKLAIGVACLLLFYSVDVRVHRRQIQIKSRVF